MKESQRLALQRDFSAAGIRDGAVGTCSCGAAARYWIDDPKPPRLACLKHAQAHVRAWQAAQLESLVAAEDCPKKMTNSELLARQQMSFEAVHPREGWDRCPCGAQAPYRITASPRHAPRWACREHAKAHARRWGLKFQQWNWVPIVADWVLGPALDAEHEDLTSEGAAPKLRLIPCLCQERIGLSGPDGVWHGNCAGCSACIEITVTSLQQDWMARAAGAQQVFFLCPDCTRTATTLTQFLRGKRQRLAHTWVLNILKEDRAVRDRWANIRKLLAGFT